MDFLRGKRLLQKGETSVSADIVLRKKKLIVYYFTTDENEQCRAFDEKLNTVYEEARLRNVEMGIVIVPCDANRETFMRHLTTNYINWYSLHFTDDLIHILIYNYGVTHVPTLIVVRKDGTLVTKDGVKDVEEIGINVLVTWTE